MLASAVRWSQRHTSWLLGVAVFLPAVLLFIPILRYSLDTPFGLIDDYSDWKYSVIFTSPSLFGDWLEYTFIGRESLRYRPFWEFYNAVSWTVFGANPWVHHLARWMFHFAAILMFLAAFLRFGRTDSAGIQKTWAIPLVPVAFLVYVWMFFPNSPASRLSPQEVYTVFFLGICTLVVAMTLTSVKQTGWVHSWSMRYVLFLFGFTGLVLSKEVNVAIACWLLFAYFCYSAIGYGKMRKIMGAVPLILVLGFSVYRVYVSSGNQESVLSTSSFNDHAGIIIRGLLQVETSLVITSVFSLLLSFSLAQVIIRIIQRRMDMESWFILFLVGNILSIYLATIFFSTGVTVRYWYPLLPVIALLMAFSTKWSIAYSLRISLSSSRIFITLILVFTFFFLATNYYNFTNQTVSQHSARNADDAILKESSRLHRDDEYLYGLYRIEQEETYTRYFTEYQPFFRGYERDITWIGWPLVLQISFSIPIDVVHRNPPNGLGMTSWLTMYRQDDHLFDLLHTHISISAKPDYRILSHARAVASFFQGGTPHVSIDFGSPIFDGYQNIDYGWTIYRVPFGNHLDRIRDSLRMLRERASAGAPVASSTFDLYLLDGDLIYVREQCAAQDTDAWFFLHLTPVDVDELPGERRQYGFDNLDFRFDARGMRFDGGCVAFVRLPDYAIAGVRTGQYAAEGQLWGVEFAPDR